jgi:hypothetical protein
MCARRVGAEPPRRSTDCLGGRRRRRPARPLGVCHRGGLLPSRVVLLPGSDGTLKLNCTGLARHDPVLSGSGRALAGTHGAVFQVQSGHPAIGSRFVVVRAAIRDRRLGLGPSDRRTALAGRSLGTRAVRRSAAATVSACASNRAWCDSFAIAFFLGVPRDVARFLISACGRTSPHAPQVTPRVLHASALQVSGPMWGCGPGLAVSPSRPHRVHAPRSRLIGRSARSAGARPRVQSRRKPGAGRAVCPGAGTQGPV